MAKQLNLGLIYFPSLRSVAYLNAFEKREVYPSHIIVMEGSIPQYEAITSSAEKLGYNQTYFNTKLDLEQFCADKDIEVITSTCKSINDQEMIELLAASHIQQWVFCGGGIVKAPVFQTGKDLIHVHPGILPRFRGSTTFYYSLVEENYVGASAFYMKEEIDAGDVIAEGRFEVNMQIDNSNALFMDYILDPYVRAEVLGKVLKVFKQEQEIVTRKLELLDQPAYYIIHPFLRHLAVKQINQNFDSSRAIGVIER